LEIVMNHALEDPAQDRTGLVGILTFLVAVGIPMAAILTADMRDVEVQPGLIDWIFVVAVAAATVVTFGALAFWLSRQPHARTGGAGLTFAIVAFLATPVTFWTMVPVIFGAAGAWLGYRAVTQNRLAGRSNKVAITAVALGALAALASVAMYIATS
jgi:hypothetical protein